MAIAYRLTQELRRKLKEPIGTLIRGSFNETIKEFKHMIEKEKPTTLISVGDVVSKNLVRSSIFPQLLIVDNKVMRRKIQSVTLKANEEISVKNPRGTITSEALKAVQEAVKINRSVKIVVDGEEDLLTLVAVLYAPENSFVVYGQPQEGIVVVKVTQQKKAEVAEILKAMETFRKAK
jgi:uncharacterized protein (UPF0218 family)